MTFWGIISITEYGSNGKVQQTFDKDGNLVQSNVDGSNTQNFDNKYSAQNIHDTSNIRKADNIDTANNIFERTHKTNLDNIFSANRTREYTDKNGEQTKEYLDENGKAVGRTVTKYTDKGYSVEDQILNSEGKWTNVRSNLDGSNVKNKDTVDTANNTFTRTQTTDFTKSFKYNIINEEKFHQDFSKVINENQEWLSKVNIDVLDRLKVKEGVDSMDTFFKTMNHNLESELIKNGVKDPVNALTSFGSLIKQNIFGETRANKDMIHDYNMLIDQIKTMEEERRNNLGKK